MPRHWRYLLAAVLGLAAAPILRGTVGMIVGVVVTLTIILVVETAMRRGNRRR